MAQATFIYPINLKALLEVMYPDEVNVGPYLEKAAQDCRKFFNEYRARLVRTNGYEREMYEHLRIPKPALYQDPGEFEDIATITYPVTLGKTYNDVVTVDSEFTVTFVETLTAEEVQSVVNIMNNWHVSGTFYIEPTFRVTGY